MAQEIKLTGTECFFDDDEIIVSKTDLKGRITYANNVFLRIAGYTEQEVLGQPHSMVRHPEMPRCVFKLLWDTLRSGKEIFAYVINTAKNGDHYWVLAHVTPSRDASGNIIGYHSNRRVPDRTILNDKIIPLYKSLLEEENQHHDRKKGMETSFEAVVSMLSEAGVGYDEFVATLSRLSPARSNNSPIRPAERHRKLPKRFIGLIGKPGNWKLSPWRPCGQPRSALKNFPHPGYHHERSLFRYVTRRLHRGSFSL
jgi:PAS domain S-box-containing protein